MMRRGVSIAVAALVLATDTTAGQQHPMPATGSGWYELTPRPGSLVQERPDPFQIERGLLRRVAAADVVQGEVRLPVVLVLYADSREQPHITRDDVQAALFDGPAPRGTVTESYLEMSGGLLTVAGDVYGWVRSDLPLDSAMGSSGSIVGDRTGEFFVQALDQLDGEIDFTRYDNDGPDGIANSGDDDGYVDIITFEYLEIAASCGGPAIWPHRSTLRNRGVGPYLTDDVGVDGDTIRIDDYITQSAADCTGENVQDAAVIAHEFGHVLGLPDWYHWVEPSLGPYGRRWVLGCWALMAAGSWGCGPVDDTREPYGPAHMIGFSKAELGWITPTDPGEIWNDTIDLAPIQTSGEALRIPMDDAGLDALWIEFRDQVGFDHSLPARGVLMYRENGRVDIWSKPQNGADGPYPLTMLERDANRSLLLTAPEGGSRGESGDAWGVAGVTGALNAQSEPALLTGVGGWTSVQVHEVRVDDDRARLVISTARTPRLVERTDTVEVMQIRSFLAGVRIAGGRGPYNGVGDLPEGFGFDAFGDELRVSGSLPDASPQTFTFSVRDSEGNVSNEVSLTVAATAAWVVDAEALVERFLAPDGGDLTEGELAYLDAQGNANGRYDVGDFRRWLARNR
jgi:M6 family metalloprotease-like protein